MVEILCVCWLPGRGYIGSMFAVGVLAEWHPRERSRSPMLVSKSFSWSWGMEATQRAQQRQKSWMICTLGTLRLWLIRMCCSIQILYWKKGGEEGVGLGKYDGGSWTKRYCCD